MGELYKADINRRRFVQAVGGAAVLAGPAVRTGRGAAERIKIGQIGTGHAHASGKMETLRKLDHLYEVVGIAEPDAELRPRAKSHSAYRDLPWMTVDQLLETPGLQAVAVETEVRDLVPMGQRCVDAGKHIHLDKPAGESLSAFQTLLDTARAKNLAVQMGYMFRHNPAFRFAYKAAREGWLGTVFEIHGVMSKSVGPDMRLELAEYPGGTMFELGCHLIDSLVHIMGPPDRVTSYSRQTRPEQDSLVDNQLAVFEYSMATATIRSALVEPFGFARRQFAVCGDEGVIEIKPLEPPALRFAPAQPVGGFERGYQDVALPEMTGRYDGDFIELAAVIRGEREPEFTYDHDLAVHKAVLQAAGVGLEPAGQ